MGRRPDRRLKSDEKSKGIPIVLEISRCAIFAFSIPQVHFIGDMRGASLRVRVVEYSRKVVIVWPIPALMN